MALPSDAASVQVLIGTYGLAVPEITVRFLGAGGRMLAKGRLAAGAVQGDVSIPVSYPHGHDVETTMCVHVAGKKKIVLGGNVATAGPNSEQIGGRPVAARISVEYLRPGRESWWQLLPTLSRRFGLGKTSPFGDWTLAAVALLLLGVWVFTVRLLARELT